MVEDFFEFIYLDIFESKLSWYEPFKVMLSLYTKYKAHLVDLLMELKITKSAASRTL